MTTTWKARATALSAIAWIAVSAYLYLAWPSLAALLEVLCPATPLVRGVIAAPRIAFPVFALVAVLGLALKDRWLRAPAALAVDALVAAPAFAAIAFLVEPFLIPVD